MARTTLLPIVILLFCFLEIQAAIIIRAETNSSSPSPPPSPPLPPPPNTVSWQTAFWILVAFALNAMTQNSTLDRHIPTGVLFPMRVSPIVCAVDALEALLQLLVCMYTGASAAESARRVVQERTWKPQANRTTAIALDDRDDQDDHDDHEGSRHPPLALASQHPRTHTIVFVLGVLPQVIKLFSMRGIPLTQACGAMYLSSFLVIAGLGTLARRAAGDAPPVRRAQMILGEGTKEMLWLGAVVAHMGVWGWFVRVPIRLIWNTSKRSVGHLMLQAMVCTGFYGGVYISASVPFILSANPDDRNGLELLTMPIAFCLACLVGMEDLARNYLWIFLPMSVCLLMAVISISYVTFSRHRHIRAVTSRTIPITGFVMSNLLVFISYYLFQYDPTGTVKPAWIELLG